MNKSKLKTGQLMRFTLPFWLYFTLTSPPLIAEGKPVLEITGVESALQKNMITSLPLTSEPCDAPAWRIRQLFRRSPTLLDQAARALGYYHLKIEKDLSFKNNCWQAKFNIKPGEPVLIESVNILIQGDARQDAEFTKVQQQAKALTQQQLHHGEYEKLKDRFVSLAEERGYFDGRFNQTRLQVNTKTNRAFITLEYDSGPRYRIGIVKLQQNTYDPLLLERFINIKPGEHYDAASLSKTHRSLSDSGYFEQVSVKQDFKNATGGKIDIEIQVQPRKRTAYTVGIGAATDTGPRAKASFERRRINRRGHRFFSELQLSQVESSLGFQYIIPTHLAHIDQVSFRANYQETDTDTSRSDITKMGFQTVGERNGWVESIYLDWVSENSWISDEYVSADLLVPGISWSKTVAKNRLRPQKGYRANLEVRGAEQALFSDTSFAQLIAAGKWIEPVGSGRLILRGKAGFSLTDDFNQLPASYRFYAGGDQSVRGYEYESLGPVDTTGEVIGGEYLITGSIEYEHPITEDWSAAVFWDTGNAFDDWSIDFKQSAGIGARWHSPIGPVRLDIAIPDDTSSDDFRLHFSMGSDL
jgi:translocation and assembly module TamA